MRLGFHGRKVRGEAARGGTCRGDGPGRLMTILTGVPAPRLSLACSRTRHGGERERAAGCRISLARIRFFFFLQFPLSRWRVVVGCVGCANEMCRRRGKFFASSIPRMMDHGTWTTPQLMAFGPESGVAAAAAGGGAAAADAAVPNLTNRLFIHPSIQCRCARARCRDWGHDGMVPEK